MYQGPNEHFSLNSNFKLNPLVLDLGIWELIGGDCKDFSLFSTAQVLESVPYRYLVLWKHLIKNSMVTVRQLYQPEHYSMVNFSVRDTESLRSHVKILLA